MTKLTQYEEIFCQEVVKGSNLTDAHRVAYPKGKYTDKQRNEEGCKKNKLPKIIQRIKFLREPVIAKVERTLIDILNDIDTLRDGNMGKDQKLALDCIKHEAKLKGYEIDKSDIQSGGEPLTMNTIKVNGKKVNIKMGD